MDIQHKIILEEFLGRKTIDQIIRTHFHITHCASDRLKRGEVTRRLAEIMGVTVNNQFSRRVIEIMAGLGVRKTAYKGTRQFQGLIPKVNNEQISGNQ